MSDSIEIISGLHPDDLADLRRSGLSDKAIASMGCYSADADTIRLATGVDKISSGGYAIPYQGAVDQTGEPYLRWRLRHPTDKMRYVSGAGDDQQLYIPPALAGLPKSDLLIITEGEKKATKAVQEGIHCVAVQGVWSWADPDSRAAEKENGEPVSADTKPLPALLELAHEYKRVLVLGDSDLLSNPQAKQGFEQLAKSLRSRGIRTAVSFCPPITIREGEELAIKKQGLDDWLVANRSIAIRSLPALFRAAGVYRDGITDTYNATEFTDQVDGQLAFSQGIWRWWNGSIWVKDDCGKRRALVPQIANVYLSDVDRLTILLKNVEGPHYSAKQTERPKVILSWCSPIKSAIEVLGKASQGVRNLRGIDATLAIAQSSLRVPDDVWDADPYLLGVKNGVVDLRSGELHPPLPRQWITRSAGAVYDPAATAPLFMKFLEHVQPDTEMRKYLQRLAGYSAVGESNEQKFITFVGRGSNGKSTYMGMQMAALGDYAVKGALSLLAEQSPDKPRNDLAALAGARLVSFSEPRDVLRLDEAMIKAITGEDLVTARFLHHEFFQFRPRFTPILDTNHPPRPKDTGEAIWRRLDIVPWTVTIPKEEHDTQLRERLLKELPGILNWIIQGAKEYLAHGLPMPVKITKTSQALRLSCDEIGRWINSCVVQGSQCRARSSELYNSYVSWCTDEGGTQTISKKAFATDLCGRGFAITKSNGNSVCSGLRLRGLNEELNDPNVPKARPGAREESAPGSNAATILPTALVEHPPSASHSGRLPGGGYII